MEGKSSDTPQLIRGYSQGRVTSGELLRTCLKLRPSYILRLHSCLRLHWISCKEHVANGGRCTSCGDTGCQESGRRALYKEYTWTAELGHEQISKVKEDLSRGRSSQWILFIAATQVAAVGSGYLGHSRMSNIGLHVNGSLQSAMRPLGRGQCQFLAYRRRK